MYYLSKALVFIACLALLIYADVRPTDPFFRTIVLMIFMTQALFIRIPKGGVERG